MYVRSKTVVSIALLLALAGAVSCSRKFSEHIRIMGSTTLEPFIAKAAEEYGRKRHVQFDIKAVGSHAGIDSLVSGKCDIAISSMEIVSEQIEVAAKNGIPVKPFLVGYDIIIPIVNPGNRVDDISFGQLKQVFSGKLRNWKELGGDDIPIEVVDRAMSSGTYSVWHHYVAPSNDIDTSLHGTVQPTNSSVLSYVSENEHAIGYVSAAYLNPEVKTLAVDGVALKDNDVLLSEYHLKRPLFIYVNEERFEGALKTFIVFLIIHERGKELLKESGFFYNSRAGD